jgi:hypothetical protein
MDGPQLNFFTLHLHNSTFSQSKILYGDLKCVCVYTDINNTEQFHVRTGNTPNWSMGETSENWSMGETSENWSIGETSENWSMGKFRRTN